MDNHSKKNVTEHILSLILYALAEADREGMSDLVPVLDDALLKIIAAYEEQHGGAGTWERCTDLYQEILQSLDDNRKIRNIPTLSETDSGQHGR